ncbi:MAG TPA: DUF2147 domain-containing protein [Saprospiraceae bacterium]|nr:DUF2147 domain-containing protein [Saprospiraceae bacterium]
MKPVLITLLFNFLLPGAFYAQITGLWRVVDDKDGIEKSIVEIYEQNGLYHGRIVRLLETSRRTHCDKCYGDLKGKPLTGMRIIYDLEKTSNGGKNGKVIDPSTGKIFSCYIELESPDRLKLRGYLGMPTVGKTSYWNRDK